METITENIVDRICEMERDLVFYENAVHIMAESIRHGTIYPIVQNGSPDAVNAVRNLYIAIENALSSRDTKDREIAEDKI